ncbi:MAG: type I-E CRISPR-associated protein Cse2/CasB [Deinococcus sp.]
MTDTPDRVSVERAFIDRLSRLERGQLAELRRSLGDDRPGDSAQFLEGVIVRSGMVKGNRQAQYLIASLYALIERPHNDESEDETAARVTRAGKSLGHLLGTQHVEQNKRSGRKPDDSSSTEKRFLALLDADADALPYQLRQAVALLKGSDVKPDWARLLSDVSGWNSHWGDRIRRRWAEDFYHVAAYEGRDDSSDTTTDAQTDPNVEDTE